MQGVTSIIKAFQGQRNFSGLFDDDLESIAEIYASIADMCDATECEKRKPMSVM